MCSQYIQQQRAHGLKYKLQMARSSPPTSDSAMNMDVFGNYKEVFINIKNGIRGSYWWVISTAPDGAEAV